MVKSKIALHVVYGIYLFALFFCLFLGFPASGGTVRYQVYALLVVFTVLVAVLAWATITNLQVSEWQINHLQRLFGGKFPALVILVLSLTTSIEVLKISDALSAPTILRNAFYLISLLLLLFFCLGIFFFVNFGEGRQLRQDYWHKAFIVAGVPLLVTVLLVALFFNETLLNYMPFDSDEMLYWHQAKTFSAVGFDGGYYTYYERPALADFSHYHSPVYPMIYGGIGAVIGWNYNTAVVLNHLFLIVATLLFIKLTKTDERDFKYIAIIFSLFSPLTLFSGLSRFEVFQYSSGIVLIGLIYSMLVSSKRSVLLAGGALVLLFIMCVGRINWAPFFPVAVYAALPEVTLRKRLFISIVIGLFLGVLAFIAWSWITAPYGLPVSDSSWTNWYVSFFERTGYLVTTGIAWFVGSLVTFQGPIYITITGLIVLSVYRLAKQKTISGSNRWFYWLHLYNLVTMLVIGMLFSGSVERFGYRHYAPFVLVSLFLLIVQHERKAISSFLVAFLLYLPVFLPTYSSDISNNYNLVFNSPEFIEFQEILEQHLVYEPNPNAWCNSLLLEDDPQFFVSVPAGIGIASKFEDLNTDRYTLPLRSKYILLDWPLRGANHLALADTRYGKIYLNLDSDCFD